MVPGVFQGVRRYPLLSVPCCAVGKKSIGFVSVWFP